MLLAAPADLPGQGLPQIVNSIRNEFNGAGAPPDPNPPGPTQRSPHQFEGGTAYGGWQTTRIAGMGGASAGSGSAVAGPAGAVTKPSFTHPTAGTLIQLESVKIARPMVARLPTLSLGSVIARPDRRPDGTPLDPAVEADREFYLPEPANSTSIDFYWSPHAEAVFASRPGVVTIEWRERVSGSTFPVTYTISNSGVKEPKTVLWTERGFNGPLVNVPEARVADVNIVYHPTFFPDRVATGQDYETLNGPAPADPDVHLPPELRTLWYDNLDGAIHAFNIEGRVFVELLGNLKEPARQFREHLGFEIVDVVKETTPAELKVAIGDPVLPVAPGDFGEAEAALVADVAAGSESAQAGGQRSYLFEHTSEGGTRRSLYAVRETNPIVVRDRNGDGVVDQRDEQQGNEVLIYWKEAGDMGLLWPKLYVGYIFKWPEEFLETPASQDRLRDFYSIFARPELPGDAQATGVQLNSADNPVIAYQDDPTQRHAQITPQNLFFTGVTAGGPTGRTLLRYTNGDEIWFERVYSRINFGFDGYAEPSSSPVGSRINPPVAGLPMVGYIRQTSGNAFHSGSYRDPFVDGFELAAAGAIIPVNALPDNDRLEVWWYEKNTPPAGGPFAATHWPSHVRTYRNTWPETDPDDNTPDEIVLASNAGSGHLGVAASGEIYRQTDPALPGYNPNEEHALMLNGVAWALRDDLNRAMSSKPYVLVSYTAEDGRPAVALRRVVRENAAFKFNYAARVGVRLQAPMPLPFLPPPVDAAGNVHNEEVDLQEDPPPEFAAEGNADIRPHYGKFTFADRKGQAWVYRGVHEAANEGDRGFVMRYRYKTQAGFDFPDAAGVDAAPPVGTIVPYLRPYVNGTDDSAGFLGNPVGGTPVDVRFTPRWPSAAPVLAIGESLSRPKHGLPDVLGQTSAEVLYEQSVALSLPAGGAEAGSAPTRSVRLFDPVRAKKTFLGAPGGLEKIPDSVVTSDFLGKTYFPLLPPHLSRRLYLDANEGEEGALVLVGQFVDEPFGEDYLHLNVLGAADLAAARALCDSSDPNKAAWDSAVGGLSTVLETFVEDPGRRGVYIVDAAKNQTVGAGDLAELQDNDTAVVQYALSASGGGTGWVVMAFGNGEAFTPSAEPVSLEVFKVAPPLYRGELKVVTSANPLDEKLTLRHSGDFAGDPGEYEFAWLTALPVNDGPPALYTFAALEDPVVGDIPTWRILHNPPADYMRFRGYDEAEGTGWADTGPLNFNQIVVDDGNAPAGRDAALPEALLRHRFTVAGARPAELYLSVDSRPNEGFSVYLNSAEVAVWNRPGRTNTVTTSAPADIAATGLPSLPRVFRVDPAALQPGNNVFTVELTTLSDPGTPTGFNLRLQGRVPTVNTSGWQDLTDGAKAGLGVVGKSVHTIAGSGVETLADNWLTMRYRARPGTAAALATGGGPATPGEWSLWMNPRLAEGWIKRVLDGINPFEQRLTDLLNNRVDTTVSLLAQAGKRWEGNISLNLANINDFGLIEIYETVLNRGKDLSISGNPPLNVPAANDALLLAAGYLNDLYLLLGNEAFADAANPTVAFDTEGGDFGEFNTALFAFKGQLGSVLEEELALLRGRDDSFLPRVTVAPVYNRLVWNFTRGIDAGEAVYALNYNIQDQDLNGAADAADAAVQYPQGHGDAYGHYLTALQVYYKLLRNPSFSWTPRAEAVTVLGQEVTVDYQDERKFAGATAALARTAAQVLDLTYRQRFTADLNAGWSHLEDDRTNATTGRSRDWGADEWASRAGQGAYFHWVTANSILPETDPDPSHEGIRKVDRTTVPELGQVVAQADAVQQTLDAADARLNPLGLARGAVSFDISPAGIDAGQTHFEQVFERAVGALQNAVFAFDNAKRSTGFLRRQENSLADQVAAIAAQEQAFENELIQLYGTPYADDIGPGRTWPQGYAGPDLLRFALVETPELFTDPSAATERLELLVDPKFAERNGLVFEAGEKKLTYQVSAAGELVKPAAWTGRRAHPGRLQTAVSGVLAARYRLRTAMEDYAALEANALARLQLYEAVVAARERQADLRSSNLTTTTALNLAKTALVAVGRELVVLGNTADKLGDAVSEFLPRVVGLAVDATSAGRGAAKTAGQISFLAFHTAANVAQTSAEALGLTIDGLNKKLTNDLADAAWAAENRQLIDGLRSALSGYLGGKREIDQALRALEQADRDYRALVAEGIALQREREAYRKRAAAIVQGLRTRDFAFRAFRDEALEKYKSLFDLAARYAFLAARAYDYETGLLDASGSSAAAAFFDGIVESRALGVVDSAGRPQFSASDTGDPGLAGVLAAMAGDWSVAETRLGFNNPDRYRTAFSLRREAFRIVPGEAGNGAWKDRLESFLVADITADPDVRRYCMQVAREDGLPVPGLVIPIQTTVARGRNFFGWPIAGGDQEFSPTSFATKIRAAGVAFEGYIGIVSPTVAGGALGGIGAATPGDPDLGFLDPGALNGTPYVYLVPAGVDSMRSPPLGDTSTVRTWTVEDQALPLPFNIGNTDFSVRGDFLSSDSLSEPAFTLRKHQAFRAVPAGTVFSSAPGFTNARLIGRSVWNSQWKIVIPGDTLRAEPEVGLRIFVDTVTDIQLYLETYSYAGN